MASSVYWIHHPEHTDMFAQGYIGVTNSTKDRWEEHRNRPSNAHLKNAIKKYGWDTLIKKVIVIADDAYCLLMESKLRAADNIGWNIAKGGGKPPACKGGKPMLEETKVKLSIAKKGSIPWNKGLKGVIVAWNKGLTTPDEVKSKQRLAKLGKKFSMETRKKMSQAQLKRKQLGVNYG
jgi:hypothetical protein